MEDFFSKRPLSDLQADFLSNRRDLTALSNCLHRLRIVMTRSEIAACVREVARQLNLKFNSESRCVFIGVLKDLARQLDFPFSVSFVEISSYELPGKQGIPLLKTTIEFPKFSGKTVVILDELFDTGTTMTFIMNQFIEHDFVPGQNLFTCALYSKPKLVRTRPLDFCGMPCLPDLWLLGYGLDQDGSVRFRVPQRLFLNTRFNRGWPDLWAIIPEDSDGEREALAKYNLGRLAICSRLLSVMTC